MPSLSLILGVSIATSVLIVGVACIATVLIFAIGDTLKVGEAFSKDIAGGVASQTFNFFKRCEDTSRVVGLNTLGLGLMSPEDMRRHGQNWTDVYGAQLMAMDARFNYSINSVQLVSESGGWIIAMPSVVGTNGRKMVTLEAVEWWTPNGTMDKKVPYGAATYAGVTGRRFEIDAYGRANQVPYPSADTNWLTDTEATNTIVSHITPGYFGVKIALQVLQAASGTKTPSPSMWFALSMATPWVDRGVLFIGLLAAPVRNATHYLGTAYISLSAGKDLSSILAEAPHSENGYNFIVEANKNPVTKKPIAIIVATSHPAPFMNTTNITADGYRVNATSPANAPQCGNTLNIVPFVAGMIHCRFTTREYNYWPLNLLNESFLLSDTGNFTIIEDGEGRRFYATSRRVVTTSPTLDFSTFFSNPPASMVFTPFGVHVVSITPEEDLLRDLPRGRDMAIGIGAAVLFLSIVSAVGLLVWVLKPLDEISSKMYDTANLKNLDEVEELDEEDNDNEDLFSTATPVSSPSSPSSLGSPKGGAFPPGGAASSSAARRGGSSWISEIAALEAAYLVSHRQLINFSRYVPKAVIANIVAKNYEGLFLCPNVTIGMLDIMGFTTLCEKVAPATLSRVVSAYFSKMSKISAASGATILAFIGDAISLALNLPIAPLQNHELLGVLCALALKREACKNPLRRLFREQCDGYQLEVRIGLAAGTAVCGTVGSRERLQYSVNGEAAVTGAALEAWSKYWTKNSAITVDEHIAREVSDDVCVRLLAKAKIIGRSRTVFVYSVEGVMPDVSLSTTKKRKHADDQASDTSAGSIGSLNSSGSIASVTSASSASSIRTLSSNTTSTGSVGSLNSLTGSELGANRAGTIVEIKLEKVERWHKRRSATDAKTVRWAELFSDVARSFVDQEFAAARQKLTALVADATLGTKLVDHSSVVKMRSLIEEFAADEQLVKSHLDGNKQIALNV